MSIHEILSETGTHLNIVKSRIDRFEKLGLIILKKKDIYQLSLVHLNRDRIDEVKEFI